MKIHLLTKEQAGRLNRPDLVGKLVEVVLFEQHELPPDMAAGTRMAKDVFYKGERLGGILALDE